MSDEIIQKEQISKKVSFSSDLEEICHFEASLPPDQISVDELIYLTDSQDYSLASSLSSLFKIPTGWRLRSSSSKPAVMHNVALDTFKIIDNKTLKLAILVRNISFQKSVTVRYSWSNWITYNDQEANYEMSVAPAIGSYLGIDRFILLVDLPISVDLSTFADIEFAIRYRVAGSEFWDNNGSENYKVFHYFNFRLALISFLLPHLPIKSKKQFLAKG